MTRTDLLSTGAEACDRYGEDPGHGDENCWAGLHCPWCGDAAGVGSHTAGLINDAAFPCDWCGDDVLTGRHDECPVARDDCDWCGEAGHSGPAHCVAEV